MPDHETYGFKLRQDPIHGRETYLNTAFFQLAVNLLSAEMTLRTFFEQVKDFPAGHRGLQTGFFQIPSFQCSILPDITDA